MDTLNNGATVLRKIGTFVLCEWRGEHVTWKVDTEGNAYWGHYFQNYSDALNDFNLRVIKSV